MGVMLIVLMRLWTVQKSDLLNCLHYVDRKYTAMIRVRFTKHIVSLQKVIQKNGIPHMNIMHVVLAIYIHVINVNYVLREIYMVQNVAKMSISQIPVTMII